MSSKRALNNYWFSRIALVISMLSAVLVYFLLTRIDLIVHGELYYFGLRFSPDWADSYRTYMWLLYLCLVLPMALSVSALVFSFKKENRQVPEKKSEVGQKVNLQPVVREEQKTRENGSSMVISCPHCNKVFSRPLVMLDFAGGKPKLVNVCPYCNHLLLNTESEKGGNSNFHVTNVDEKLTHQ